jgi:NAD+ kinase
VKTLSLFSRPNCPKSWGVLNEIVHWARVKGLNVVPVHATGGWADTAWDAEYVARVRNESDLAIAVGGDGTLLGVARDLFGSGIPVLGVNTGNLGFLTDVASTEVGQMLDAIKAGEYRIEERILLEATVEGTDIKGLAFNDVVLRNGDAGRMVEYEVLADGESVFTLRADGLVVATPTGSTAYALSAAGPILHPSMPAVALVPICPHSLTARPITLPSACRIDLVVRGKVPALIVCDAQPLGGLLPAGTTVSITQGELTVPMLHLNDYSFFKTLKRSLGWSTPRER